MPCIVLRSPTRNPEANSGVSIKALKDLKTRSSAGLSRLQTKLSWKAAAPIAHSPIRGSGQYSSRSAAARVESCLCPKNSLGPSPHNCSATMLRRVSPVAGASSLTTHRLAHLAWRREKCVSSARVRCSPRIPVPSPRKLTQRSTSPRVSSGVADVAPRLRTNPASSPTSAGRDRLDNRRRGEQS